MCSSQTYSSHVLIRYVNHVQVSITYVHHILVFITYMCSSHISVHYIHVFIIFLRSSHVFITSMCSSHTCRERRLQMAIYFCMLHINTNQIIFVYIVQTNHMSHYLQLTVGRQHQCLSVFHSDQTKMCRKFAVILSYIFFLWVKSISNSIIGNVLLLQKLLSVTIIHKIMSFPIPLWSRYHLWIFNGHCVQDCVDDVHETDWPSKIQKLH